MEPRGQTARPLVRLAVPLLVIITSVAFFWRLRKSDEHSPFLLALALFLLGYIGLAISIYPYVVPRAVSIWQAAAPAQSLGFMLIGIAVMVPLILAYTAWSYWVFRGKVAGHSYH